MPHHPPIFFFLLILCFFSTLTHQSPLLPLHPNDHKALLQIHTHLNLPHPTTNSTFCNSAAGIFCSPFLSNASSYLLRVTHLVLPSKHLQGTLSPAIGDLSELQHLSLPHNHISGQIPPQITHCHNLEILDLKNNHFSGEFPAGLSSSLIHLRVLDLSSNKLDGSLDFLQSFHSLLELNLADNNFVGKLPSLTRSCPNLRFINISGNSLIDDQNPTSGLAEKYGIIPKRYVYTETSGQGNQTGSASTSNHKHKSSRKKAVEWILKFLSGILAGAVSGLVLALLFKLIMHLIKNHKTDTRLTIFSPVIKNPEDLAFLDKEDALESLEVIGRGGCGEVYKMALPGSSGIEIAIKKIIQLPTNTGDLIEEDSKMLNRKMRQIRSEIQTVGQIRHRNLLPLLAYLPRLHCHYLVYEYMKNGSLQDYLKLVADGKRELDWLGRHKIAVGIAAGLEYLHMNHKPRIIHRDLKPGNVLLDDKMEARIADFGLAAAVPDAHTHVTTSNVAGTVGYIAPEYYQTFKFTDKCDVYSFGVVLGVLVIGRMPSDEFFQRTDEMSMVQWMRKMMTSEDPRRAIDPKLLGSGFTEQMLLVLKVACFCTLDNPIERPDSSNVRAMLSQISH
ncbi:leucine-rich repeat receptor-like serine/threonine/tyrosine-protein kinase SOBIR1 [Andrographis paniculata]|uniref:leucine-rich repeat receptor-like serine/threonine/tyrosine-protein kinase SOBIR1 n=1 Tax=Andrographis paniculata TaxID=175694 RepID=UPI0021E814F0|nr:leucine-rich repeat receptor-like serine/threonine/tyrosine-protein kinase SOBIR1 [Andrographis paniculata]